MAHPEVYFAPLRLESQECISASLIWGLQERWLGERVGGGMTLLLWDRAYGAEEGSRQVTGVVLIYFPMPFARRD